MSEDVTLSDFSGENNKPEVENEIVKPTSWGNVPSDWYERKIREVTELVSDGSHNPPKRVSDGIQILSSQNIQNGRIDFDKNPSYISPSDFEQMDNNHSIEQGDLLMTIVGSIGRSAIVGENSDFALQRSVALLRTNEKISSQFLKFVTDSQRFHKQADSRSRATAQGGLYLEALNKINLPVPPLLEQRKIATVLYTVDRAIEKTEEVIQQYESLKSGVLEDLLRKGVKDHEQIERNIGPLTWEMPESWAVRPMGELAELAHGHQFRSDDFSDDGEIPVLKIGQITGSGIDLSNADRVPEQELEDYADYTIEQDSPLIALSGATWGKTGYFESYNRPVLQNYRVGKVVADSTELEKKYVYYLMQSSIFQKQLRGQVVRQAQENIGKSDFERIRIPIPEISEQERMANIMTDVENCIQKEQKSKQILEHLKQGIIQDLLSGTVRTTDTNIQVPDKIAQHG